MGGGSHTRRSDPGTDARLSLLGTFRLVVDGVPVEVPSTEQRILALLVMLGRRAPRSRVAGELWPDQDQARALSNLRSAIWRMPESARNIIGRCGASVTLLESLAVDLDEAAAVARRLHSPPTSTAAMTVDRELLLDDLLPGFDETWLVVPREQHRQRRLHALETLALDDLESGRPLDAVDTALAAVAAEPLRESAQLLLVRAHLAAGNRAAARDQFHRFRHLLATELQVEPSAAMTQLVNQPDPASSNSRGDTTVTVVH